MTDHIIVMIEGEVIEVKEVEEVAEEVIEVAEEAQEDLKVALKILGNKKL